MGIRIFALLAPIVLLGGLWWYTSYYQSPVYRPENLQNTATEPSKSAEKEDAPTDTLNLPAYRVLRVVDGDTLDVEKIGKVRLIGINAPESVKPDTMPECYGKEASEILKGLLGGESVRLVYDVERYDQYGRALAYVYRTPDGLFVNAELVRVGAAEAREYRPNTKQKEILEDFEAIARQERFGLWALCQ